MPLRIFLSVLLMVGLPSVLRARITRAWTDQEIFEKADLVVIARALSTKSTKERSTLTNLQPHVKVSGVETEFESCLILKGPQSIKRFRLHYYAAAGVEEFANGPWLIQIPKGEHPTYLLFLTREDEGRYAPATDQTDPAGTAVLRLRGANGVRGHGPEPQLHNEHSGKQWTYPEMLEKADLVVKADWVSIKDGAERTALPDTDVEGVGVTTEFKSNFVLKGPKDIKKLGLHHYKFQDADDAFRGYPPQLIRIIPPITRGERQYSGGGEFLLFLVRESDGRYAPVTGQTDPAVSSVLELTPALF